MEYIHEQLEENIIEDQATQHNCEIFPQLRPFRHGGFLEDNITAQVKTNRKCNRKADQESCDMGADRQEADMDRRLAKNEIIGNEEKADIQQGIESAAGSVAESLKWHDAPEHRIEQVYHRQYYALY